MIDIELRGDIAIVSLRAGKANAMNLRLLDAIVTAFDDVETSGATAVVITGEHRAFSAGLALPELIDLPRADIAELMHRLDRSMLRVLTFPRATVAAINGHAVAGGCVLALMCDVRVMAAGDAQIGLNEVQLGIGLPAIVVEPLRHRVPPTAFGPIALEGRLLSPAEALRLELVDEVVERDALIARAIEIATARSHAPLAYAQIKQALLAPVLEQLARRSDLDRDAWLDTWFSDHARRTLRAAVDRIVKR